MTDQRKPHNPDRLSAEQIGAGYRLAYTDEIGETFVRGAEWWNKHSQEWQFSGNPPPHERGAYLWRDQTVRIPIEGESADTDLPLSTPQWHPVSCPPTEADAGQDGRVLVRTALEVCETLDWREVSATSGFTHWFPLAQLPPIPAPVDPFTEWQEKYMNGCSPILAREAYEAARKEPQAVPEKGAE